MKSAFTYLVLTLAFNGILLAQEPVTDPEVKVIVYGWANYIPAEVVTAFTKETGIKVEYITFSSDELMYARTKIVKGRAYDVIVAPTHLVTRMRNEGLLQALDHQRLENFDQLDARLLNKPFDPGNAFSIPYAWGNTSIVVNTNKVDSKKITRWSDLWQKQWSDQVFLIDSMREIFMVALKANGHDINSTDEDEIKQAHATLQQLLPNIQLISNAPDAELVSGDVSLGVLWSSRASRIKAKKPAIQYIYPEKGPLFWISSFVVPARAPNPDNAYRFINYLSRPKVAARCAEIRNHATAIQSAKSLLDEKMRNNKMIYPPAEILAKMEFPQEIGQAMKLYELYWEKFKTAANRKLAN